jgi:heptosyltransferase-2
MSRIENRKSEIENRIERATVTDSRFPIPDSRLSRLVVAPNWIGDTVMSLPVVRALRRATSGRFIVLAPRGPAAIYRAEGSADAVIVRSGLLGDVSALRRERCDEAWLLPNSFRSAVAPFLAGIPTRLGYSTDGRRWLLTHPVEEPPRTGHQLHDYDALLLSRGIEPEAGRPTLPLPARAVERAAEVLQDAGLAGPPPALLAPASAGLPAKRWPAARYAELARRFVAAGRTCALVVGPGETAIAGEVAERAGSALPTLGTALDPVELAALLARASVVVANDSGPMHLAAAVGAPVVGLFGPTDPARTGPVGERTRVVKRGSMMEIGLEEVLAAVNELLLEAGKR